MIDWISVDERFPDEYKEVLIFRPEDEKMVAYYDSFNETFIARIVGFSHRLLRGSVTHWAEINEPENNKNA